MIKRGTRPWPDRASKYRAPAAALNAPSRPDLMAGHSNARADAQHAMGDDYSGIVSNNTAISASRIIERPGGRV